MPVIGDSIIPRPKPPVARFVRENVVSDEYGEIRVRPPGCVIACKQTTYTHAEELYPTQLLHTALIARAWVDHGCLADIPGATARARFPPPQRLQALLQFLAFPVAQVGVAPMEQRLQGRPLHRHWELGGWRGFCCLCNGTEFLSLILPVFAW